MQTTNPNLFNALVKALPTKFLLRLKQSLPRIYFEAHQMAFEESVLQDAEAEYLMKHNRGAIFESLFRQAALDSGLHAIVQPNIRASARYTLVRATNFVFTANYVDHREKSVCSAHFRNQHASLNLLAQQRFTEFDTSEVFQGVPECVYCILLHGPDPSDKIKPGFMEFAFPNVSNTQWVDRYDFNEVLNSVLTRNDEELVEQKDLAFPRLKPQRKTGEK